MVKQGFEDASSIQKMVIFQLAMLVFGRVGWTPFPLYKTPPSIGKVNWPPILPNTFPTFYTQKNNKIETYILWTGHFLVGVLYVIHVIPRFFPHHFTYSMKILSGQIIIHQPRFPWNKAISFSQLHFGRYNLTRSYGHFVVFFCHETLFQPSLQ